MILRKDITGFTKQNDMGMTENETIEEYEKCLEKIIESVYMQNSDIQNELKCYDSFINELIDKYKNNEQN